MDTEKVIACKFWRVARNIIKDYVFPTLEKHNPELANEFNIIQGKIVDYFMGNYWDKGGVNEDN